MQVSMGVIIVSVLGVAVVWALFIHTPPPEKSVEIPDVYWLATVDLDNNGKIHTDDLFEGEAAAIVIEKKDLEGLPDVFAALDGNNDGLLTVRDPLFWKLKVVKYSPSGKVLGFTPLREAGIRAIRLKSLSPEDLPYAIMSDNSRRWVKFHQPEIK